MILDLIIKNLTPKLGSKPADFVHPLGFPFCILDELKKKNSLNCISFPFCLPS